MYSAHNLSAIGTKHAISVHHLFSSFSKGPSTFRCFHLSVFTFGVIIVVCFKVRIFEFANPLPIAFHLLPAAQQWLASQQFLNTCLATFTTIFHLPYGVGSPSLLGCDSPRLNITIHRRHGCSALKQRVLSKTLLHS